MCACLMYFQSQSETDIRLEFAANESSEVSNTRCQDASATESAGVVALVQFD